ncbi:uncharacterized protein CDAR_441241, partial [Caerostris darwini]
DINFTPQIKSRDSLDVISESDLLCCTESEILEGLSEQGVSHVARITIKRGTESVPTKHLILTSASTTVLSSVKAGYLHYRIFPYIPNPLRCFICENSVILKQPASVFKLALTVPLSVILILVVNLHPNDSTVHPNTSSTTNLPATPRHTNCKLKSYHKKKNLIANTTPSIKCKSSTSKSKPLPKFKKHFDTNRFEPLASFVLETESHTEHPDSSNSEVMLEYDATVMVLE